MHTKFEEAKFLPKSKDLVNNSYEENFHTHIHI